MCNIRRFLWFCRVIVILSLLIIPASLPSPTLADDPPPCDQCGQGATEPSSQPDVPAYAGDALTLQRSFTLRGGYVAAGTGMRNRGYGSITISGIPAGATVVYAFLYWVILNPTEGPTFNNGTFNGNAIAGTLIGSGNNPCWNVGLGFAYRANVTSYVTGNGTYTLKGFASGSTAGGDPWTTTVTPPLSEGASLVVVFSKANYPNTLFKLYNGYALADAVTPTVTQQITGFTASNPVGDVRTTFIGADGQSSPEPDSTFNGAPVPQADWDGTDRQTDPQYSQGNLWDTDTARVGKLIKPGDTSATLTVGSSIDCLVWVAQVFAMTNGAADTDKDGLLDGWEANGYDADGDGVVDVDLPNSPFNANTLRKDIYVEMDYMSTTDPPTATDLGRIMTVFADAPVSNPNGKRGIAIHLDAGAARTARFNLGGGNAVPHDTNLGTADPNCANYDWTEFNALKTVNFAPARRQIFHYMVWAHNLASTCGTVSGISRGIPSSDFIVSLGGWPSHGTPDARVGTFIHELGHNLNLHHGGGDDNANWKPNYLSIMNYFFQIGGVPRTDALPAYFGYVGFSMPSLNEASLNENVGLNSTNANTYRTRWYCPDGTQRLSAGTANGPLDWNCGGGIQNPVAADINYSGARTTLAGPPNDWSRLIYDGGLIGAGAEAAEELFMVTEQVDELTFEQDQAPSQEQ